MLSLFVLCNICVLVTYWEIHTKVNTNNLHGQLFAIRLMQVTLGMVIGLSTTFLGIVAAWFGLTENAALEGSSGAISAKMAAVGPGALLILCGTLIVYTCINKEFYHQSLEPISTLDSIKPVVESNENT
ncbi:hypothetical protein Pla108_33290 [Botrimarina colliarenosi]|uniref:Uncharacterized protein n=2 Tax=Botrimarina colliarenosi TaxID=2528001 RepID=A0A5C6A6X2_9BACT|nr:hypothetical protein Pla108_33290 [Botrimarina colliarenosi]